jgi:hypothetical protein
MAYATLYAIGNGVFSRPEDIAALAADPGRRAARHGWRAQYVRLSVCGARANGEKAKGEE